MYRVLGAMEISVVLQCDDDLCQQGSENYGYGIETSVHLVAAEVAS